MPSSSIDALSPVDGRYRAATEPLRALLSEAGLIRERIRIEALWLLHLTAAVPQLPHAALGADVRRRAQELAREPGELAPPAVKDIEARINHDVKAVEYFVRQELAAAGASAGALELVHFGCTSEDINNVSYARLLGAARAIHAEIARAADAGKAVLLVSADLAELRSLCDRILVLARGRIVAELPPDAPEDEVGEAMLGGAGVFALAILLTLVVISPKTDARAGGDDSGERAAEA